MTALNKQALREVANAANIASWGKWESYKPHKGARGYEVRVGAKAVAQHCLKVDSAFIAAANPATVLALLDELEESQALGANESACADSTIHLAINWQMRCKNAEAKLEAAERRNAELTEFIQHIKKCLVKNGEYAPLSHEGIDTLLGIRAGGIRAAGIGVKGE